jgi:plastocyanin
MTAFEISWRRRFALALVLAAAALSLVGLRAAAGQSATSGDATASAAKAVKIANFAYHPTPLTVSAGTTVTFTNRSGVTHTASGSAFNTGHIAPGKSASVTLKKPGTYVFHCMIHPFMHGKIIVR